MYIGLVFSQAGLPVKTIAEATSTLTKRLQDVMAFESLNSPSDAQLLNYIRSLELPQGYDEEIVSQSLLRGSRCFTKIIALFRKEGAASIQNLHEKFCSEFPTGRVSLTEFTNLLTAYEKAVETKRQLIPTLQSDVFRINRYLFVGETGISLRTTVTLDSVRDPERIAKFFDFSSPLGSTRLGTVSAGGQPLLIATIGNGTFRIAKFKKLRFDGALALKTVDFALNYNKQQFNAAHPIRNAGQLQSNEVHYFSQLPDADNHKWFYLGSGDLSTQVRHVLALVPKRWTISSDLSDEAFRGECQGFSIWHIEKDTTFTDSEDGSQFSLALGQEARASLQYMLNGAIFGYAVDGTPIYRGIPAVYRYSDGCAVRENNIVWSDIGHSRWTPNDYSERLRGCLRNNGRIVKRFNIITIPDDADVKTLPITHHDTGEIRLCGWALSGTSLDEDDRPSGYTYLDGRDSVVDLPPDATQKSDYVVLDCQTHSGQHFKIQQPLPRQRSEFLLDDHPINNGENLSLTAAESLCARVVDMNPYSTNYCLEIRPNGKQSQQEYCTCIPFVFVGNNKESSLSFADDMSQAVQRTLRLAGTAGIRLSIPPKRHLQIHRHRNRLRLTESNGCLSVVTSESIFENFCPDIIAEPLFNPNKTEPILLPKSDDFNGSVIPLDMKLDQTTVWMLHLKDDTSFGTQPTFFAGPRDPRSLIKLSTLMELWVNEDPLRRDSHLRSRVKEIVAELIRHPEDSDWTALESTRQRTGVKGLARLPLWQALSDSVDTAFTLAILLDLRSGDQNHFLFNEVSKVQNWRWELNHLASLDESIQQALKHMQSLIPISGLDFFERYFSRLLESRYFQHHPSFEPKLKLAFLKNGLLDPSRCQELLQLAKLFNDAASLDAAGQLRSLWQEETRNNSGFVIRDDTLSNKARLAQSFYLPIVKEHFPELNHLIYSSAILTTADPTLTALFVGLAAWETAGFSKSLNGKKQLAAAEPYFLLETLMSVSPQWTIACERLAMAAAILLRKHCY